MTSPIVENYEFQQKIRSVGTFYTVWSARQLDPPRPVEVRLVHHEVDRNSPEFVRFAYQFKTLSALEHPGLVRVLDTGLVANHFFYVTELRNSRTLREHLGDPGHEITVGEVCEIGRSIAGALEYLHSHRVLHRDLSLDSVFVDQDTGEAYIGEFSMVKNLNLMDLTSAGTPRMFELIRTPEFQSGAPIDERTDIYLLGRMLFLLLVERHRIPRKGDSAPPAPVDPERERHPAFHNPGVPDDLDRIVTRCTESDPGARFQGARELLDELDAVTEDLSRKEHLSRISDRYRAESLQGSLEKQQKAIEHGRVRKTLRLQVLAEEQARETPRRTRRYGEGDAGGDRSPGRRALLVSAAVLVTALITTAGSRFLAPGEHDDEETTSRPSAVARPGALAFDGAVDYEPVVREILAGVESTPTTRETFPERWSMLDNWIAQLEASRVLAPIRRYELSDVREELYRNGPRAAGMLDSLYRRAARHLGDRDRLSGDRAAARPALTGR